MTVADVRVAIVDDHPVYRLGMAALLGAIDGVEVVGQAATAAEALDLVGEVRPDVVLLDLHLPDASGIEVTREVRSAHPDVAILIVTMVEDADSLFAALRAGARGYLVKGAGAEEITRALAAVRAGEVLIGAGIADRTADLLVGGGRTSAFPELTEREHEVLDAMARGLDNAAIARRFVLSPKTVRNHVSNVMCKIGVNTRGEAIARARDAGLGE